MKNYKQILRTHWVLICLLYTSDAADEEDSVDLGGRRIIKNSLSYEKLQVNLENALGNSWDIELEPYRIALAGPMLDTVSKSG